MHAAMAASIWAVLCLLPAIGCKDIVQGLEFNPLVLDTSACLCNVSPFRIIFRILSSRR